MRVVLYAGAVVITTYGLICLLLYLAQDRLLYLPTREVARAGARVVQLRSSEATLKLWELHADAQAAILYFGGNAEDVGASVADFDAAFPQRAVCLVNYRGYGGSTGRPSEAALIADALAVYDFVATRHGRVAVIGRSLGSGIAVALAAQRPVERLILVTPYDSIANVAADHFGAFPVRWLLRDRYDSRARIGAVRAPILLVVAEHDEVVPRARSDALAAAIAPPLRHSVLVAGATHNDVSAFPQYLPTLKEFLSP
ncbi:MAG: alpha/beta hydrolase [Steroidobacteraceae bacterium]